MKSFNVIFVFLFLLSASIISGQVKIGYVDSDTIMEQYTEAQDAQKRLDALMAEWQEELKKIETEWKTKYDDYEKRKLIMSNTKRAEVEKELIDLEKKMQDFKQEKFGPSGELFKKQEELMKPVNNKIFTVIEEVAKEEELDFVFDRSGDIIFLYAKEEYDITNKVIEKLK
ncbi:MAG: OmpH family outer membrane protein [Ignavibacteriales bacterium]|nr:OmpH family outer membrane protein [Ignavibacteriales bacterium]